MRETLICPRCGLVIDVPTTSGRSLTSEYWLHMATIHKEGPGGREVNK